MQRNKGFTLVELLVVIAIIGILAAVVMLAINPVEMMKKGRDATRMSDLENIRKALDLSLADNAIDFNPSVNPTPCHAGAVCDSSSALQTCGGTGWITNLNLCNYLGALPLDPKNVAIGAVNSYYYFAVNATHSGYEVDCYFESVPNQGKYTTDGGNDATRYEVGTDLTSI